MNVVLSLRYVINRSILHFRWLNSCQYNRSAFVRIQDSEIASSSKIVLVEIRMGDMAIYQNEPEGKVLQMNIDDLLLHSRPGCELLVINEEGAILKYILPL